MAKVIVRLSFSFILVAMIVLVLGEIGIELAKQKPNLEPVVPMQYRVGPFEVEAQPEKHGERKHGQAYWDARKVCEDPASPKTYRLEADKETFHIFCQGPDGKVHDLVTKIVKGYKKLIEKTAFPRDSPLPKVLENFKTRGATPIHPETVIKWLR